MFRFFDIFINDTNNNDNIEQINETSAYLLHSEESDYTISRDQLLILINIIKVQTLRILAMYVLSLLRLPNFLMSVANSVKFQLISRIIWQGINIPYKLRLVVSMHMADIHSIRRIKMTSNLCSLNNGKLIYYKKCYLNSPCRTLW